VGWGTVTPSGLGNTSNVVGKKLSLSLLVLTVVGCGRLGYDAVGMDGAAGDADARDGGDARIPTDALIPIDASGDADAPRDAAGDAADDAASDASASVICADAGTARKYCSTELTHDEAAAYCATQGMTLTSVMNSSDNGSMINGAILLSGTPFWIGLDDIEVEGEFHWDDGSALRFTSWDPGQPDDAGGAQDCVVSGFDVMADTWADVGCDERHPFVCGL
jgi:hypothetical protein